MIHFCLADTPSRLWHSFFSPADYRDQHFPLNLIYSLESGCWILVWIGWVGFPTLLSALLLGPHWLCTGPAHPSLADRLTLYHLCPISVHSAWWTDLSPNACSCTCPPWWPSLAPDLIPSQDTYPTAMDLVLPGTITRYSIQLGPCPPSEGLLVIDTALRKASSRKDSSLQRGSEPRWPKMAQQSREGKSKKQHQSKQLEKNRVRVEQRAMPSSARARPPWAKAVQCSSSLNTSFLPILLHLLLLISILYAFSRPSSTATLLDFPLPRSYFSEWHTTFQTSLMVCIAFYRNITVFVH